MADRATTFCWACGVENKVPAVARCWGGEHGIIETSIHVCRSHLPMTLIAGWKPAEYGSDLEKQYQSQAEVGSNG